MSIVSVKNLRKTFDKAVAVEDISFTIERGEIVGLLGQNGAGKSTTIQILLGLITATAGEVTMFDLNPWRDRVKVLARTNFSSAYVAMPHNLRVRENLEVFARLYGVRDRKQKSMTSVNRVDAQQYLTAGFPRVEMIRDFWAGDLCS